MRQSLKIAISLLAALLLFAGFAIVSFSGLFNVVQASFFLPGLERSFSEDLGTFVDSIDKHHQTNLERFAEQAKKDFVLAAFSPTLSRATIQAWADFKSQAELSGARLIGADGRRILYSTFTDIDVTKQSPGRITYANYDADGTEIPAQELTVTAGGSPKILNDAARGVFVYALPVSAGDQVATLAVYVPTKALLVSLSLSHNAPVDRVTLIGKLGILINGPAGSPAVGDSLAALWSTGSPPPVSPLTLTAQDGTKAGYRVFTAKLTHGGFVGIMVSDATFEMTDFMKGLLLGTFFFTVFLLVFLVLNLRTDPLEVLRQRVKRFQIELITELVETPGGVDWGRWRREMEARKDEITWQIQRGIGRVSRKQKPVIEEYMSKSWAEIIDLLSRRAEAPQGPPAAAIDMSRLEALIKAALQNASFVIPAAKVTPTRPPRVEEIGAEEVIEVVPEAPGTSEPVTGHAAAAEAEEIEEAEAAEEAEEAAEVEEAAEAEPAGEPVAVSELEAAEEIGTAEELEELEELPSGEAVKGVAPSEPVAVVDEIEAAEEIEAVEEIEPVEEIEAVEEVEAAESPVEAPSPAAAEAAGEEPAAQVSAMPRPVAEEYLELEPVDDDEITAGPGEPASLPAGGGISERPVSEFVEIRIPRVGPSEGPFSDASPRAAAETAIMDEPLEELVPLMDIAPLPPEPIEEGLELLPAVEEEGEAAARPTTGGPVSMLNGDAGEEGAEDAEALDEGIAPQAQDSGEIEVLEAMDEGDGAELSPGATDAEKRGEIEALLSAGSLKVWTVEELQRIVEENKSAIEMEDGVFRIKQDVYEGAAAPAKGQGLGLRELAEQVVRREKESEPAVIVPPIDDLERGQPGSITEIMPDDEPLDFAPSLEAGKESPIEESLSAEREKSIPMSLKRNGIDYEAFLSVYPRSFTQTVRMKSLVEVSRRVSAVNAVLLVRKDEGYRPSLHIGLGDTSVASFRFDAADPFFVAVLAERKAALVVKNPAEIRFLRERIDQDDLRYMKRAVFMPAEFQQADAYIFLSFSSETQIDLKAFLARLIVQ